MKITSYIHPTRTYLPCTGVGRHINQVLTHLQAQPNVSVDLLVSQQWLGQDNRLDSRCPLRNLPTHGFPTAETPTERSWKLLGLPRMDKHISTDTDWLYAPMETYLPVSQCPVAVTIHDIQAFETDLPWSQSVKHRVFRYKWGRWVRRTLSHSRLVFTVSEFSKQRMVKLLGADPDKVVVVGNGVEQSFFEIAGSESTLPVALEEAITGPYALMIGGLRKKKGADHFLAIARHLQQQNSPLKIAIAGSSEPDYIKAAADHPNIVLLGLVPDDHLPILLRHSRCLLFLSLYEGFGIPPLEAMAAGTPAIVANRASLPEVVGDAGIVVDPADTSKIVSTLTELLKDGPLREGAIAQGYQHAKQYTWASCAKRVTAALSQAS